MTTAHRKAVSESHATDRDTPTGYTDTLSEVRVFHETFGALVKAGPDISDDELNALRIRLLQEELDELKEALADGDLVEVLDALTDIQYVLDGAFLSFGLQDLKYEAFNEVQRANMSKLGKDGKPILRESDNKILKGPDYKAPDLVSIVEDFLGNYKNQSEAT